MSKFNGNRLSLIAAALAVLAAVNVTRAEEAKEVTLKGTMQCAKCSLHEADAKGCQDVLTTEDGTKYYLAKNAVQKSNHVCSGKKDGVSVTGTVEEKDGKKVLTATKVEGAGKDAGAHDHSK